MSETRKRDRKIAKLVKKIIEGPKDFTKEELQLYVNHAEEVERRLQEKMKYETENF